MTEAHNDPGAVRAFVSSTFRDMHAERDEMVTVVEPELRERLSWLELHFELVDLRWMVPGATEHVLTETLPRQKDRIRRQ